MNLFSLKIRNFRNEINLEINPEGLIHYIYSPNGTGKTNLLEAIQCLTVGKTLRAKAEGEVMNYNFSQIEKSKKNDVYVFGKFRDEDNLEFSHTYFLENGKEDLESSRKKKTLLVNKTKVSINDFIGRVPSIWFSPESIKIITSSPKSKREYFDEVLIQLFPEYLFNLRSFNRALKQRNQLLQDHYPKPNQIRVWTEQVIKYGSDLIRVREEFFKNLNLVFEELNIIERYKFQIDFRPNILIDKIFPEDISFRYREELRKTFDIDKRRGTTNTGPHRDDWYMLIDIQSSGSKGNYIRADKFASRGQQRMSLIILQLALIKLFERKLYKKRILLLDDIFSELDKENEKILLDIIEHNQIQSFITGVEKKDFPNIKEYNLEELLKG